MHDNSLYEAGNRVRLNSRVEKENSLPDARDNVKLSMMENHDPSLNASSEVELHPIVEKGISEDLEEKHTPCFSNYSKALSTIDEGHNMNEENNLNENEDGSPPISSQLRDLQSLCSTTPLCKQIPEAGSISLDDQISTEIAECVSRDDQISTEVAECVSLDGQISTEVAEPRTPLTVQNMCSIERRDVMNAKSPWETFSIRSSGVKNSLVQEYLRFLNTAEKEELKKLKGIGEKRATFILELREESPEPFKSLDDLKDIGLSAKQKNACSARHKVNSQMNQIPKSVSATTKKLPGYRSLACENKVVAMKSEIKGRKLFDEATRSAAKSEKATSQKKPIRYSDNKEITRF